MNVGGTEIACPSKSGEDSQPKIRKISTPRGASFHEFDRGIDPFGRTIRGALMNIVQDRTPPGFHRGEDRRKQLLCRGFPDPFRPRLAGLSNGLNRLKHSPKVFFALGGAFEDGIGLIHGVSGRLRLLRQVGVLLAPRRVAGFGLLRPIFFPSSPSIGGPVSR